MVRHIERCNFTYVPGSILCLAWLISTPLFAQSFTASVQGTVTDASGALVPRAPITLLDEATNIKQTKESDERGRHLFALVTPGRYTPTVEVSGFQPFVRSGIQLQVAQETSIGVRLSPGDMPLNTRDPLNLALLTPGVVGSPGSTRTSFISSGTRNSLSGGNTSSWGGSTAIQCHWNLCLERSVSVFDVAHRWLTDFTYELPFGRGKASGPNWNRFVDRFLGQWHVNGILMFQSGAPLVTALYGGIMADSSQRPNLLFNPSLPGSVESRLNLYLNPNAFSRPAPYVPGNAPRVLSSVRAPGPRNADLSIFKNLALTGGGKRCVQLRLEAFNAANTPIFGSPDMTVGATSFGVISSQANSPRELQVAAKFYL